MRVVLDTSVLVSALIAPRGRPARVLQGLGEFDLVISEGILAEVERVLHYKLIPARHGLRDEEIQGFSGHLREASVVIELEGPMGPITADPDDDQFLACAREGRAECLVSGDPHLIALGAYRGIEMVTPAQFLALLDLLAK